MKKIFLLLLVVILFAIVGTAGYLKFVLPDVNPAPEITITGTPERIAHGAYLANHVTVCMDCHSTRDWTRFSGPLTPGTLGIGGEYFGIGMGFPGSFYSKNITPQNLGQWTDGEIYRAITTGVNKDGESLFPVMPYLNYGKMDKEDVYDIIAYLRQLPASHNRVPERHINFPMNLIINTIPTNNHSLRRPDKSDRVNYGHYIVTIAACAECHTQVKNGQIIGGMEYAGGRPFQMSNGTVRSANLTPDAETGLGNWTEDAFIARFKAYTDTMNISQVSDQEVNTIMPWSMYAGIDTADLRAIYAYLRTIKPIKNKVEHFQLMEKQEK